VSLPENAVTADGRSFLVRLEGQAVLYPADSGEPWPIPYLGPGDQPLQVSPDRHFAYVRGTSQVAADIDRVDLSTGSRAPWKTFGPRDPAGLSLDPVLLRPDGRSYCYSYTRLLSDLFLVEGLR
jgi:hypothetical protein